MNLAQSFLEMSKKMRSRNSELARGTAQSSGGPHEKEKSNAETMALLRRILLRPEREKLTELSESLELLKSQLAIPEILADNLEPYIGRMLARRFAESPEEMARILSPIVVVSLEYHLREAKDDVVEILSPIMAEAIKRQIEESEGEFVEVFYPLIGRMIAKAILEAVKHPFRWVRENLRRFWGIKTRRAEFQDNAEEVVEDSLPEREYGVPPRMRQRDSRKKSIPILQYLTIGLIVVTTTVFGVFLINHYMSNPQGKPEVQQNPEALPEIISQSPKAQAEIEGILKENPILFNMGEEFVPRKWWNTLNEIAQVLKKYQSVNLQIIGYSDTSDEDNVDIAISLKRAKAVKEYLRGQDISPNRLEVIEGGDTDKFSSDTTLSGQWMNRRVEFAVLSYEKPE